MSDSPRQWWQWVLMYPTIIIALFAGLPQIYQWASAVGLGLSPFANVDAAKAQEEAWQRNVDCLHGIDHVKPSSSTNYAIDLVSCPSGDILVTLTPLQNPSQQISRWIVTQDLFTQVAWSFFVQPALAQSPQPSAVTPERIIDIKKQGATIIRRVQLSSGACVDETIDAYTGRRSSQKPAPCGKF
ncbi:MAG: hypothetical protein WB624_16645 [Xanthobacteraceae bacterium]|jgi:hypothetical protein